MRRTSFNDHWTVGAKANSFAESITGKVSEPAGVTLPHDALIGATGRPQGTRPPPTSRAAGGGTRSPWSSRPKTKVRAAHPRVRGCLSRRERAGERDPRSPNGRMAMRTSPCRSIISSISIGPMRSRSMPAPMTTAGGTPAPVSTATCGCSEGHGSIWCRAASRCPRRRSTTRWRSSPSLWWCRTSRRPPETPSCASRCSTVTGRSLQAPRHPCRRCRATGSWRASDSASRRRIAGAPTIPTSIPAGPPFWRTTRNPKTRSRCCHVRDPLPVARPRARPAGQRGDGLVAGCVRAPRQRVARFGHHRPGGGTPGRAAESRGIQCHSERP